jgi:hypothetical protein
LYKAREILVTSVISLVAGTPAVAVTWGILVGFVVISLAIEVGKDVGAKIVLAVGGTTETSIRTCSLGTDEPCLHVAAHSVPLDRLEDGAVLLDVAVRF